MAGSADREYVQDADHGSPGDEATNASIAPESPPAITVVDEAQPTNHARGSSTAPGLLDPGTTLNDAMRSPVNGLGQNGVETGQPAFGSAAPQTNDLVALKNDLLAELNSGQYSGATLGHVQAILSDINTAISSANAAANGASVPGMEQALRASQLSIINAVNTDPVLANPAPQNGPTEPTEPEAKPAEDAEPPAENTEPAETAETGDATDATQVTDDLDAAIAEMEALIAANPDVFSGLTVDDAEEIVHQIQLELAQINEGDASPGTAQELGIDITDIVTGDIDLASLAAQLQPNPQEPQIGNTDVHALPQTAAIPVNDVPATIGTGEAPTMVVDHGHSGTPEPVNHLHVIWE
ncbi:MAG: hypothetical protein C0480_01585 [Bradyrhizobium sp.]|nr:hypothetical protein [Bradyrhizobium sp.]